MASDYRVTLSHLTFSSTMSYADAVANRRRPPSPASPQFPPSFQVNLSQIPSNNPYYLHPSENPSLVLVSPILNGLNYHSWSRAMKTALQAKNKYVFVTGELPMPSESESLSSAWIRCNTMVVSWLTKSVSSSIAQSILWLECAADIWSTLKSRYSKADVMKIYELQEAISRLTQQSSSVTDYYSKLRGLWEELWNFRSISQCKCTNCCCCDSTKKIKMYQEQDFVIKFLSGLNLEFAVIKSQILLMEPLPCLASVFSLVVEFEKQRSVSIVENQSNVFFVKSVQSESNLSDSNKRVFVCVYCGKDGHTVDRCFRKHGFPPGFVSMKKRHSGSSSVNAYCATAARQPIIIDSVEVGRFLSDEEYQMLISLLKPSQSTSFCSGSVPIDQDVTIQLARKPKLSFVRILGLSPGAFVLLCGTAVALLGPFCLSPSVMLANFNATPIALSGPHFSSTSHALKKVLTGQASLEVSLSTGHSWMEWLVASPLILTALYTMFLPCIKVLARKFNSTSVSPVKSPKSFSEDMLEVRDV